MYKNSCFKLSISNIDNLLGHPVVGNSFEGFVIENILNNIKYNINASFYRNSIGEEIDLILEFPDNKIWAIEIKKSLSPTLSKSFFNAVKDVQPDRIFVVYMEQQRYKATENIEYISLPDIISEIKKQ